MTYSVASSTNVPLSPSLTLLPSTTPPTTTIYTLSLHDALPIYGATAASFLGYGLARQYAKNKEDFGKGEISGIMGPDRKSTRLNSSHRCTSYAVFCLKKKKIISCTMLSDSISPMVIYLSRPVSA